MIAPAQVKPELSRDHLLLANRRERTPDQLLIDERPIDLRRIEERLPVLDRGVEERSHLLCILRRPI